MNPDMPVSSRRIDVFWAAAPWISRALLLIVALSFIEAAVPYLQNPAARAAADNIALGSAAATGNFRIGFGAFPLAFAAIFLVCAVSQRLLLHGLVSLVIALGLITAVRVHGFFIDGPTAETTKLLAVELAAWTASIVAAVFEALRRHLLIALGEILRNHVP